MNLYSALSRFGEVLLYLYFAMPFIVDERLALVSLSIPHQAEWFGTVQPYYSLIHLLMILVAVGLFLLRPRRSLSSNKVWFTYIAVNVVALVVLFTSNQNGNSAYLDFAVEFFRLASVMFLASMVLEARQYNCVVLARGLITVFATSLLSLLVINQEEFFGYREGRFNGVGLELTSTGHVAAMMVLLSVSAPLRLRYRLSMVALGSVALLLSGSRFALILSGISLIVLAWIAAKRWWKRVVLVFGVLGFAAIILVLTSDASIGLGRFTGGDTSLGTEYTVGRGTALITTIEVLKDHPLGYVDSDWAIQDQLVGYGWPSHTHSNFFQSYLRYGPMVGLFWGLLIWRTIVGKRRKSPYAPCLWFIIVGSALDYYGDITKAMLVVFMVAQLNEAYLLSARHCERSKKRLGGFTWLAERLLQLSSTTTATRKRLNA